MEDKGRMLVSLLNSEIERIQDIEREPGWNKWALLGALSTCIWFISKEIEISPFYWNEVFIIFLILFFSAEFLNLLSNLLSYDYPKKKNRPGFFYLNSMGWKIRRAAVYNILLYAIIVFLLNHLPMTLSAIGLYSIEAYTLFCAFVFLTMAITSYLEFPMPNSDSFSKSFFCIISLIILLIVGTIIFQLYAYVLKLHFASHFQSWRTAGLIFCCYYLADIIIRGKNQTPILDNLIEIRRNIVLQKTDFDSTKNQLDIALAGLRVSDVFQKDVNEILRYFKEIEIEFEAIHEGVTELKNQKDNKVLQHAILDSIQSHLQTAKKIIVLCGKKETALKNKIARIQKMCPDSLDEIKKIYEKIESEKSIVNNKLNSVEIGIDKIYRLYSSKSTKRSKIDK